MVGGIGMAKPAGASAVVDFYDMHPISETQILEKLRAEGADLAALTQDDLQRHDQDHYGGLAANDALADWAGIGATDRVLDLCCGLGGPARYLAHRLGCRVTGVDLTVSRVEGAARLTELTRLGDLVDFRAANALDLPFKDGSFDVVYSQEGFCHIPNKPRLIAECARMLKPGGRIVFTDILVTVDTPDTALERLNREMTFNDLASYVEYESLLRGNGCPMAQFEDLGPAWRDILQDRLRMYRGLKDQTVLRFGQDHFEKWDSAYSHFVGLYATGGLSGGRYLGIKSG